MLPLHATTTSDGDALSSSSVPHTFERPVSKRASFDEYITVLRREGENFHEGEAHMTAVGYRVEGSPPSRHSSTNMTSTNALENEGKMGQRRMVSEGAVGRPPVMKAAWVALWELVALTSFNFPYGLICGTMGLCVLPAEALRLYPESQSITLGISLGIVGVSQLVCPIAGKLSDLHETSTTLGKRKPFVLYGTVCACVATLGMWYFSLAYWGLLYYVCLFLAMVALNVVYSVQCGFVPDLVDETCQGSSSGLVAVHTLVGSGVGFALVIATKEMDYHGVYILYILLLSFTTSMSLWVAHRLQGRLALPLPLDEEQGVDKQKMHVPPQVVGHTTGEIEMAREAEEGGDFGHSTMALTSLGGKWDGSSTTRPTVLDIVKSSFTIDTTESFDFFWVFLGRTFYYVGVSVQAFILYYLRDVIGTAEDADRRFQIGCIALLAQGTAASIAYPIGKMTDPDASNENMALGRKPLIYIACGCMSSVYVGFLIAPLFGRSAFAFVMMTAAIYGAGNGCFLAVDYALALATLPNKETAAQSLGIWGVSAFIGSAVGPLLWGGLIEFVGGRDETGNYLYRGYVAMLTGGIIATVCAGMVIKLVKKSN